MPNIPFCIPCILYAISMVLTVADINPMIHRTPELCELSVSGRLHQHRAPSRADGPASDIAWDLGGISRTAEASINYLSLGPILLNNSYRVIYPNMFRNDIGN